jgi:hypothetical protein
VARGSADGSLLVSGYQSITPFPFVSGFGPRQADLTLLAILIDALQLLVVRRISWRLTLPSSGLRQGESGKVNHASSGNGALRMIIRTLLVSTKTYMVHIISLRNGQAPTNLLRNGGNFHSSPPLPLLLPHIRSGKAALR